jgi:23S rRNA pseudouridine1911/1915/1917 synthase
MVVHPTYRHPGATLMNGLLARADRWPAGHRPSIVGRLDKLTSGLVVAAKTTEAHAALQRAMSRNTAEKDYLAVVYGTVEPASGMIDLRLARAAGDRRRVVASDAEGTFSLTHYSALATVNEDAEAVSLVRCRIATGRMHQIRVHLASRGWPVVGDPKYGEPRWRDVRDPDVAAALQHFSRQALHAWRLRIVHPFTREPLEVVAPLPDDIRSLLEVCGLPHPVGG